MPQSICLLVASVLSVALLTVGCQKDSPEQDAPPGIFTTTLPAAPPPTVAPAAP